MNFFFFFFFKLDVQNSEWMCVRFRACINKNAPGLIGKTLPNEFQLCKRHFQMVKLTSNNF